MDKKKGKMGRIFLAAILLGMALVMSACGDGDTGSQGATGPQGPPGPPGEGTIVDVNTLTDTGIPTTPAISDITVSIDSPPVITFKVTDSFGRGLVGLTETSTSGSGVVRLRYIRFLMAKLVPGATGSGDPSIWQRYAYERTPAGLTDHEDGTYTYVFEKDLGDYDPAVTYDAAATTRLGIQLNGIPSLLPVNAIKDFVPNGAEVTVERKIATVKSCNECHGRLTMHGGRVEVELCIICHNPTTITPVTNEGYFPYMIHHIHSAQKFNVLDDGVDYSEMTWPPENEGRTCRKCHNGEDEATPQGNNWQLVPNQLACRGCHSDVDFETGLNHPGGAQANNKACIACHGEDAIAPIGKEHLTEIASPNNPNVPEGLSNISYVIFEARVSGGNVETDFSILRETGGTVVSLDVTNLPADLTVSTRRPSFLFGWAEGTQDGIANPADFNNFGEGEGDAKSVNLGDLIDGSEGTVTPATEGGVYTATLINPFPAGAERRTVALQSYFAQTVGAEDISRHAVSAVKTVDGDTKRRQVIDPVKCAGCHEWLELHGGSRVIAEATDPDEPPVCTLCHNVNKSSGGRTLDPATASEQVVAAYGADPLLYPEKSMNWRNLVHGIHSSNKRSRYNDDPRTGRRTFDFDFVRPRNDGIVYNFSNVTFPGILNNCLTCHIEGAYELPLQEIDDQLPAVDRTTGVADGLDPDFTAVIAARESVPNTTDWVSTMIAGACRFCHDTAIVEAHLKQNGGSVKQVRIDVTDTEACELCHGADRLADLNMVHKIK